MMSRSQWYNSLYRWAVFALLLTAALGSAPSSVDGHSLPPWFATVFAVACMVFGLFECMVGYRFFRPTLFVLGFVVAAVPIFLVTYDHLNTNGSVYYAAAFGLVAGILVGFVCTFWLWVGVFFVGAALGAVAGLILNTAFLYKLYTANTNVTMGVAVSVLGVIFGVWAVLMMRVIVIISTSIVGAYLCIRGLGGLIPKNSFPDEFALTSQLEAGGSVPSYVYGYIAGIVILACLGIFVQFRFTAPPKKGAKDANEEIAAEAETGLDAIISGKKKKKKGKKGKKGKKAKAKALKGSKANMQALLDEENGQGGGAGADGYYDDGYANGTDGYDENYDAYDATAATDGYDAGDGYYDEESGNGGQYGQYYDSNATGGYEMGILNSHASHASVQASSRQLNASSAGAKSGKKIFGLRW